jgi:hypothetical protein
MAKLFKISLLVCAEVPPGALVWAKLNGFSWLMFPINYCGAFNNIFIVN